MIIFLQKLTKGKKMCHTNTIHTTAKWLAALFTIYWLYYLLFKMGNSFIQNKTPIINSNVCELETADPTPCQVGFAVGIEITKRLIQNLLPHCDRNRYPTFKELYDGCAHYYKNSNDTISCLSGLTNGASVELQSNADLCQATQARGQLEFIFAALTTLATLLLINLDRNRDSLYQKLIFVKNFIFRHQEYQPINNKQSYTATTNKFES